MTTKVKYFLINEIELGIVLMSLGMGFYFIGTLMFFDRTLYILANVIISH